ncbi:MAG: hypothetical protein CMK07_01230 [Ponticaulis sp.]|nr:hypothetical protein [Ponticaulis sp.]
MNPVVKFLNRLDASAWRAVIISCVLLASVAAVFVLGRMFLFTGESDGALGGIQALLNDVRTSPFGLLIVIGIYCGAAFLGAPQFGLIGATVLAFGPTLGFGYAWIATLASSSMAFWLGRVFGFSMVRKYGGDSVLRLSRFMGKNDFLASAIVRNVPTAPAIVVNMAFGASEARFLRFLSGTAIGIVPKTLLIALFGQAVAQSMTGNPLFAGIALVVMGLIWIPLMLLARSNLIREKLGREATRKMIAESEAAEPEAEK